MKKMYFQVKFGYGHNDFISVDEDELSKAMRAQINGTVVQFNEGTLSGNHIISITPDYQRAIGWNRDYQLSGEDYDYIGKKRMDAHRDLLESKKKEIYAKLGENRVKQLN